MGGGLAKQGGKKLGAFKPPMAKELGVKRGDQQGRLVHGARQSGQFLGPAR